MVMLGSRGSVLFFMKKKEGVVIPITHSKMTRFMITLDEAVKLVWHAFDDMLRRNIRKKNSPMKQLILQMQLLQELSKKLLESDR